MNFSKISFAFFIIFLVSCSTQKKLEKPQTATVDSRSNAYFFNKIAEKSYFDVLKIQSKIDMEMGKSVPTMNATIYIEQDKKIWLNISAFFMNVARGLVTPDGVKMYEKLEKTYVDSDFSYLNKLLKINLLNYNSFENLLVGKNFIPVTQNDFSLVRKDEGFLLKSIKNQKIGNDEYSVELLFSLHFDLMKINLNKLNSNEKIEISYENWITEQGNRLPKNVKIIIKGEKTDQILIENTKFEFSKMETPYSVPSHYKKRSF